MQNNLFFHHILLVKGFFDGSSGGDHGEDLVIFIDDTVDENGLFGGNGLFESGFKFIEIVDLDGAASQALGHLAVVDLVFEDRGAVAGTVIQSLPLADHTQNTVVDRRY